MTDENKLPLTYSDVTVEMLPKLREIAPKLSPKAEWILKNSRQCWIETANEYILYFVVLVTTVSVV